MLQGKFRWKAILLLVVCSALLGLGWFFLHRLQIQTLHSQYLKLATRAEEKKDFNRAVRFLWIYLSVKGDDVDARAQYGVLLEKLAQTQKERSDVSDIYERVLEQGGAKKEQDIRLRAAKLSMGLGHIDNALAHLRFLQKADSSDPEVNILLGDCKWVKKESDKAKQQAQSEAVADAEHDGVCDRARKDPQRSMLSAQQVVR